MVLPNGLLERVNPIRGENENKSSDLRRSVGPLEGLVLGPVTIIQFESRGCVAF